MSQSRPNDVRCLVGSAIGWHRLLIALLSGLLVGCGTTGGGLGGDNGGLEDPGAVFGTQGTPGGTGAAAGADWVVVLEPAAGRDAQTAADRAGAIARETGFTGVRAESRGRGWFVVVDGGFGSARDERARDAVARARAFERADGSKPFAGAFLLPPLSADPRSLPPEDLRSVRASAGDGGLYTLQIGAYGRLDGGGSESDLREARAAAEAAVAALRAEGERAFYYHGPALSTVTVGVFEAEGLGLGGGEVSPEYLRLRDRFPRNLVNGAELFERDPSNPGGRRVQASRAVEIPR